MPNVAAPTATSGPLSVGELAEAIDEKPVAVIKFLMTDLGVMASMTQTLDPATCVAVVEGFGKFVVGVSDMGDDEDDDDDEEDEDDGDIEYDDDSALETGVAVSASASARSGIAANSKTDSRPEILTVFPASFLVPESAKVDVTTAVFFHVDQKSFRYRQR